MMSLSEKKQFNMMLEYYDAKEFKKALEKSDSILEKFVDHTETQAFKALILNGLKRGNEAFDLIKKVLFKNLGNFTCWHVYGMLNRSNKRFDDARKAFLNALK
jgi:tetratricopeptide (TPR) repeat protein